MTDLTKRFLGLGGLEAVDADTAAAGTLAYLPYDGSIVLYATDQDGSRLMLDLTGKKPFGVWELKETGLGAGVAFSDWRIEVEPASSVNISNQSPPWQSAFLNGKGMGIVGRFVVGRQVNMPITTEGAVSSVGGDMPRAAFASWRIVAGSADSPVLLVASPDQQLTWKN